MSEIQAAAVEAAARVIWEFPLWDYDLKTPDPATGCPQWVMPLANQILAAAAPLIRRATADEIEAEAAAAVANDQDWATVEFTGGMIHAAEIARRGRCGGGGGGGQ